MAEEHDDSMELGASQPQSSPAVTIDDVVQTTVRAILLHEEAKRTQNPERERVDVPRPDRSIQEAPQPPIARYSNSEIAALLPEFAGQDDDVNTWIKRVDMVQATYEIPDKVIQLIAVGKLSGQAKQWFHTKLEYISKPWAELKVELKAMFETRINKVALMRKMEARKWRRSEKFSRYFTDKVSLCNQLNMDEGDIIDYVIDGFDNSVLQSQARMNRFIELNDLLNTMKYVMNEDRNDLRPERPIKREVAETPINRRRSPHTIAFRCYNCNAEGHRASECPAPKRERGSCFSCGSMDHRNKDCPRRRRPPPADSAAHLVAQPPAPVCKVLLNIKLQDSDEYQLDTILDCGSPASFLRRDCIPPHFIIKPVSPDVRFTGMNSSEINVIGSVSATARLNDFKFEVTFYVIPVQAMSNFCLLGRDVLCREDVKFTIERGVVNLMPAIVEKEVTSNEVLMIDILNYEEPRSPVAINVNPKLPPEIRNVFEEDIITHYLEKPRPEVPVTKLQMKILVSKDHVPFYFLPRRLSYSDKIKVEEVIRDLLKRGVIRCSSSQYSSPIVLVRKKDGKIRLCVDFRELNKITARDNFPLPLIDDQIEMLRDKKCFTRLDLKDAFHHVTLDPDSVQYTSFVTPMGQYEYTKMPFGLKNSPAVFMRFINACFRSLIDQGKVIIYIDDILIATTTVEENILILNEVYEVLVQNLLYLRLDKCSFGYDEINFLGYRINADGVSPSQENIQSILNFPSPRNYKMLHSFLGLASYFRRFIPRLSILARPLYDLLKKEKTQNDFVFGNEEFKCMEEIKQILSTAPVLAIYSPFLETQLHCDASSVGFASILLQRQSDNKFHPVFYFSKRTSVDESKYHSFELEALCIVYSLQRFRVYLKGIHFKIITDCNSLKLTLEKKDVNPRILRWTLIFQEFDYVVEHRKAEQMVHVDALSRCFLIESVYSVESTLEKNLCVLQGKDDDITKIRDSLVNSESPVYELRDGLVYRKVDNNKRLLFYVPAKMVSNVIRSCHDEIGHVGVDKTCEVIQRTYWFPHMRPLVKDYVQNCLKCVLYSSTTGKREGVLYPIPKGNLPFDTIHCDHYGPLEKTGRHFKYVFEVIDGFSKFVKFYPCKTTNASETVTHLTNYFRAYSRPSRIICDRGSNFRSEEFKSFLDSHNIHLILVAAGTPRANGQIERINKNLRPMIAKLTPDLDKWDRVLPDVEFAFNNTFCRSIGNSPSVVLFGIHQKGKVRDPLAEYLASLNDFTRDVDQIREVAAAKIVESQAQNKAYFDKKHKAPRKYAEGDYVVRTNIDVTPGLNKKHLPLFKGPYQVTKVLSNDRYVVEDIPGFQVTQRPYKSVLESSNLRPWNASS